MRFRDGDTGIELKVNRMDSRDWYYADRLDRIARADGAIACHFTDGRAITGAASKESYASDSRGLRIRFGTQNPSGGSRCTAGAERSTVIVSFRTNSNHKHAAGAADLIQSVVAVGSARAARASISSTEARIGILAVTSRPESASKRRNSLSVRIRPGVAAGDRPPPAFRRPPLQPDSRAAMRPLSVCRGSGGSIAMSSGPRRTLRSKAPTPASIRDRWYVTDLQAKLALICEGTGWGSMPSHLVEDAIDADRLKR
jgi:hypothetical protein